MRVVEVKSALVSDLEPYFVLGNENALREVLSAIATAYAETDGKYANFHMDGIGRWLEIFENLMQSLTPYSVRYKRALGQPRLVWSGLAGEAVEMIVIHGQRDEREFTTSRRGPASEDLVLLGLQSFVDEETGNWTSGCCLFHHEEQPGSVSVYMTFDGRTRDGWKRVECDTVFHIGTVPYRRGSGDQVPPIDIQP